MAHVISAPGSRSPIHNHRMWGVIGIDAGQEDNHLYRRVPLACSTMVCATCGRAT